MHLPEDPFILLSYINTQLRDFYPSLEELQKSLGVDVQTKPSKVSAASIISTREDKFLMLKFDS